MDSNENYSSAYKLEDGEGVSGIADLFHSDPLGKSPWIQLVCQRGALHSAPTQSMTFEVAKFQ